MKLRKKQKNMVENEIINRIGSFRVPTKDVINDVYGIISRHIKGSKKNHVSGVISGMDKRGLISGKGGFCQVI